MGTRFLELQQHNESLLEEVHSSLVGASVKALALTYVDNAGISRVKTVPAERLRSIVRSGIGMSPVFDAFLYNDSITSSEFSGGPMGDLRLFPDLSALVIMDCQPGWAWVPVERFRQDLEPHPLCHRQFARRCVKAIEEHGLVARAAFELEWTISEGHGNDFVPACDGPAYGLDRLGELDGYILDIYETLEKQGIRVEQIHPEYAPGQFEISIEAASPVAAADLSLLVRYSIKSISRSYGYNTSFAPLVVPGGVGNGGHLHFSLSDHDGPLFRHFEEGDFGLTAKGSSVIAGLLRELPALSAIGCSSPSSFSRLAPHRWAGAYACWGRDNREAALRFVGQSELVSAESANLEIKPFDLSSSPYLVVGSVLCVAASYVEENLKAPDPINEDPGNWSDDELLSKYGIRRLPESMKDALAHLEESTVIKAAMGVELFTAFKAVKEAEIEATGNMELEEIVESTRWKY